MPNVPVPVVFDFGNSAAYSETGVTVYEVLSTDTYVDTYGWSASVAMTSSGTAHPLYQDICFSSLARTFRVNLEDGWYVFTFYYWFSSGSRTLTTTVDGKLLDTLAMTNNVQYVRRHAVYVSGGYTTIAIGYTVGTNWIINGLRIEKPDAWVESSLELKLKDGDFEASAPRVRGAFRYLGAGEQNDGSQLIGTTEETITFAFEQPKARDLWFYNRGENYIELGFSTGVYDQRLYPGIYRMPLAGTVNTIYVKANTAACRVDWWAVSA